MAYARFPWPPRDSPDHAQLCQIIVAQSEVVASGCWLWLGFIKPNGYGQIHQGTLAHRASYYAFVGDLPRGRVIDHTCHGEDQTCRGGYGCLHRRCVNPGHLEAVTTKVNNDRGLGLSGHNSRKTHCPAGHPYDTVRRNRGGVTRGCRACWREAKRAEAEARGHW
jgi:hypothetical protein